MKPRRVLRPLLGAVLTLALARPAGACSDYGGCWAVPSLEVSQSIIRDRINRQIIDQQVLRSPGAGQELSAPATSISAALAQLRFKPSVEQRQRNFAAMVEAMRPRSPAGAQELARAFANHDVIGAMARVIAPSGLAVDNLADAYALWWMTVWANVNGVTHYGERQQALAVRGQAAMALAQTELASASNARKQELAESLIVEVLSIAPAFTNSANDPQRRRALTDSLRRAASTLGIDLDAMALGPNGFVRTGR